MGGPPLVVSIMSSAPFAYMSPVEQRLVIGTARAAWSRSCRDTWPRPRRAVRKLLTGVVDMNELRVCHPDELASLLGERYPRGLERCARLRSALNDLYR